MDLQVKRRAMLILHDVLVHPVIGVLKALSLSTKLKLGNRLHEATLPPLPKTDRDE